MFDETRPQELSGVAQENWGEPKKPAPEDEGDSACGSNEKVLVSGLTFMILLRRREDIDERLGEEVRLDILELSGSKVKFEVERVGPETLRLDHDSWSMSWVETGARLEAFGSRDWICAGVMGDADSSLTYGLVVSCEHDGIDPSEEIRGGL